MIGNPVKIDGLPKLMWFCCHHNSHLTAMITKDRQVCVMKRDWLTRFENGLELCCTTIDIPPHRKARDIYFVFTTTTFGDIDGRYHTTGMWAVTDTYFLNGESGMLMRVPYQGSYVEKVSLINEIFSQEQRNNLSFETMTGRCNRFFIYLDGLYYLDKRRIIEIKSSDHVLPVEIDTWNRRHDLLTDVMLNPI